MSLHEMPELRLEPCRWCGGMAVPDVTCPLSVRCPDCHREPGQWCQRPSGHKAMELHRSRVRKAEAMDQAETHGRLL